MKKYVALLRGVNVGGNRRVPNSELKKILEEMGFHDVLTYINSGNAIFASSTRPRVRDVQAALEGHFGFLVPTIILSDQQIIAIAEAIPKDWSNDSPKPDKSGQKSDVLYLFDEINEPGIIDRLGHMPELETMIYVDGAVLTTVSRVNQTKGSLQKLIGTKLYSQVTIRNITTAKKLAELVRA